MKNLIKIGAKKYAVTQWHTQAGKITTNSRVKIDFSLTGLGATKIVTCNCHVYDTAKIRNDMILRRDILAELGLNMELSDNVIEAYDGPFQGSTAPMVGLGAYEFKDLETGKLHSKNCL